MLSVVIGWFPPIWGFKILIWIEHVSIFFYVCFSSCCEFNSNVLSVKWVGFFLFYWNYNHLVWFGVVFIEGSRVWGVFYIFSTFLFVPFLLNNNVNFNVYYFGYCFNFTNCTNLCGGFLSLLYTNFVP